MRESVVVTVLVEGHITEEPPANPAPEPEPQPEEPPAEEPPAEEPTEVVIDPLDPPAGEVGEPAVPEEEIVVDLSDEAPAQSEEPPEEVAVNDPSIEEESIEISTL